MQKAQGPGLDCQGRPSSAPFILQFPQPRSFPAGLCPASADKIRLVQLRGSARPRLGQNRPGGMKGQASEGVDAPGGGCT